MPIEIPDDQSGWLQNVDTKQVYENAGLETKEERNNADFRLSEGTPEWDKSLLELFHGAHEVDTTRNLLEFNPSDVPQFAIENLREAIFTDAVFSQFDTLPSDQIMQLRNYLEEELTDGRWNMDGIANRLQDLDGNLTQDEAERIARTETQSIVANAREIGYEKRGDGDDLYYWVGSIDDRTTEACKWLIGGSSESAIGGSFDGTNPNYGGNPVTMEELSDLVEEAAEKDPDINTEARQWTPHINCRKTFVRYVE